ncbi:hypothetical protein E2C01_003325 [Portunus trituberculatus]|uniref:Uncharacterized protein n=1 Tax=Portunus trituberculatus TaxID=210409 RepID=A0A5B7CQS6_PORTR|nr:hypothetical protein [Portunus trituberculatus]
MVRLDSCVIHGTLMGVRSAPAGGPCSHQRAVASPGERRPSHLPLVCLHFGEGMLLGRRPFLMKTWMARDMTDRTIFHSFLKLTSRQAGPQEARVLVSLAACDFICEFFPLQYSWSLGEEVRARGRGRRRVMDQYSANRRTRSLTPDYVFLVTVIQV